MATRRRATRRQRGGFLDWLFGSSNASANTSANTEKKNGESANASYAAPVMGGRRRKSRKSKAKKSRKVRKGSRRH